jgi:hypothetical protein
MRLQMAAVVLVLAAAGAASAQQRSRPTVVLYPGPAPKVSRTVIYNGPTLTVKYRARNVTLSDRVILRELSDAESDPPPAVVTTVTPGLVSTSIGTALTPTVTTSVVPAAFVAAGGGVDAVSSALTGDVVPISTDDSGVLRQQRRFMALARVGGSPRLRAAFGLDESTPTVTTSPRTVRPAAGDEDRVATQATTILTLTDGRRVACTSVEEGRLWVVATTTAGKTLKLRASEILRIEEVGRR